MAFEVPTLDEAHEFAISHLGNSFADDPPDVSQGSFLWLFLLTLAAAVTDNHAHQAAIQTDLLPDSALDDTLIRWGTIRGVVQKGATGSSGSTSLRVTGTSTTPVTLGLVLSHVSGLQFEVSRADIIGPGGTVDVDVQALSTGAATNLGANEILTFVAAPPGIQDDARLVKALTNGADLEDPGALRARILSRWSDPPRGGTATDYVQWALTIAGISQAYVYPLRAGYGTVDLVALQLGSSSARIPVGPQLVVVQAALSVLRPIAVKAFRVLTVTPHFVDVEDAITTDGAPQNAFDWDDTAPPTCSAFNGGTRTLTLSALPVDLLPGKRLSISPASGVGGTGAQRIVEAFGAGPTDVILQADATGDVPGAGDTIYAGGALVDSVRAALQALLDSLGSANPDATPYGPWEGNLDPDAINAAARSIVGVKRSATVLPAALVQANDPSWGPDTSTIELLCSRRILVRAAH